MNQALVFSFSPENEKIPWQGTWQRWWDVSYDNVNKTVLAEAPIGFAKAGCYETKGAARNPSGKD